VSPGHAPLSVTAIRRFNHHTYTIRIALEVAITQRPAFGLCDDGGKFVLRSIELDERDEEDLTRARGLLDAQAQLLRSPSRSTNAKSPFMIQHLHASTPAVSLTFEALHILNSTSHSLRLLGRPRHAQASPACARADLLVFSRVYDDIPISRALLAPPVAGSGVAGSSIGVSETRLPYAS